ncbi:MAG: TOBE domain-containing protein [Beijerinckiaceae bacterium]|nr:TOBE domain-containing protein [Beijerinckiaceae bacterium]
MVRNSLGEIDSFLAWRSGSRLLIGRERIELLEAVAEHKSITKAAEIAGFSYKTAWDAVNAVNSILPRPAFITRTGGTHGGGAEVTEEGRRLIHTFRRLEEKLGRISTAIAAEGLEHEQDLLFWGIGLKLSVRNTFLSEVTKVAPAPVNVEVKLRVSPSLHITAVVTNESVKELSLEPGRRCVAMVNASSIVLAQDSAAARLREPNQIMGTVIQRTDDGSCSEVAADIGEGRTIIAVVPSACADEAGAILGAHVLAAFKARHVLLAAD